MLKRFTVKNFKNFGETTTLELGKPSNYEFNSEIIKDGCVTKAIVFGENGSGKSNLALALFDIILHLTDKERALDKYQPYRNLNSKSNIVEFEYTFDFDGTKVLYKYGKSEPLVLRYENLFIDGREVLSFDFIDRNGAVSLEGTETMRLSLPGVEGADNLSRVKYVKSNAALLDNNENRAFSSFVTFVDNMLMFYSLWDRRYQGFNIGIESFTQSIVREGKLKDFENYLREMGIEYDLIAMDFNGSSEIFCKYPSGNVLFSTIASTGTMSLTLFYYWFIKMEKASLVYIDEYDAFYHFELSQKIVELLKEVRNTQIILSTHNTDLISNDILRPDAYYNIKDGVICSFDKLSDKELRRAHNLQKMYKAGAFNE